MEAAELPLVHIVLLGFMCLRKDDFNMLSTGFSPINLRSMLHLVVVPGKCLWHCKSFCCSEESFM